MANSQQIQQYVNQAMQLLQRGDYEQALKIFVALEQAGMQDFRLFRAMASAYERLQQNQLASQYFSRSLAINPTQPDVLMSLARLYTLLHEYSQAQACYEKALGINKDDGMLIRYARFLLLEEVAQPQQALSLLSALTGEGAMTESALLLRAKAQGDQGNRDEQQALLEQALTRYPESRDVQSALAWYYKDTGDNENAQVYFTRAAQHPKARADDAEGLVLFYLATGAIESARRSLAEALTHYPESRKLMKLQASLRYEMGDDNYLSHYERKAVTELPPALAFDYVDQCLNAKKLHQAQIALDSLQPLHRSSAYLTQRYALLNYERGDYAGAIDLLNEIIVREPGNPLLLQLMVKSLFAAGDIAASQPYISRLLEQAPDDQFYWALQSTQWRLSGDDRYAWLCDYASLVRPVELHCPPEYGSTTAFLAELKTVLEQLHTTRHQPLEQSLVGGTQTTGYLFERRHPVIQSLKTALHETCRDALSTLVVDETHPTCKSAQRDISFATSWSVRLQDQGFHVSHVHPKGWYSSAFYVDVPELPDNDANAGWLHLGKPGIITAQPLDAEQWIQPQPGKLALFPSFMWHGTAPFESQQSRLTVAFDLSHQRKK
ncbi:putative 2OG-Fe(II) oxygenase [Alteromonas halophila]|uniref:Tetratricopeptide repeat-containing 2OG-Fe(II) oxygenase n=1 Tax=Alteromonas halophila TaxID=516698 RepID=A0A918JCB8_9ALTE|nr:putative 2OG-Fe(II) oxygenase [Alteromonas halophila]GGW74051.1 tetratricopeptide repeat-containing 2OG-Fe(II) oxygenase [Alteromonas halophila]